MLYYQRGYQTSGDIAASSEFRFRGTAAVRTATGELSVSPTLPPTSPPARSRRPPLSAAFSTSSPFRCRPRGAHSAPHLPGPRFFLVSLPALFGPPLRHSESAAGRRLLMPLRSSACIRTGFLLLQITWRRRAGARLCNLKPAADSRRLGGGNPSLSGTKSACISQHRLAAVALLA